MTLYVCMLGFHSELISISNCRVIDDRNLSPQHQNRHFNSVGCISPPSSSSPLLVTNQSSQQQAHYAAIHYANNSDHQPNSDSIWDLNSSPQIYEYPSPNQSRSFHDIVNG